MEASNVLALCRLRAKNTKVRRATHGRGKAEEKRGETVEKRKGPSKRVDERSSAALLTVEDVVLTEENQIFCRD